MSITSDDLRSVELAIVALFTGIGTIYTAISERRGKKKEVRDKVIEAKVKEVADTVSVVPNIKDTTDKVHVLVNGEKTRMMEDLVASRLLNLTMAEVILESNPNSEQARRMVELAKKLYDQVKI